MSNNQNYNPQGLDRLYQAVQRQAKQEFLEALRREYPRMLPAEEADALNLYHEMQTKAEQKIIAEAEVQGRGK